MKVIKDSAIYLFGELVSKSIPFLLLPYLSRKLGVEGFGELSYYQTFLALFAIFIGLSQDGAVARYFYRYGKRSLDLVVTTGYAYTITIGALGLIACWVAKSEIMFYLVLSSIFQVFLVVQLSIRQCQKQALPYTLIQLGSAITNAVFTVLMLEIYETALVEKRILAILFGNILIFVFSYLLFLSKYKTTKRAFNLLQYKKALMFIVAFGFPLLFHIGSGYLKNYADRLLVYEVYGSTLLGLYSMGINIALILSTLITAINKATIPYYFEGIKNRSITKESACKFTLLSFVVVPIPVVLCLLFPSETFSWLLGEGFEGSKYYIAVFLLAKSLSIPYIFLANYLFFYGKTRSIAICSVFSVVVYVISLMILSTFGVEYIPFATVISEIVILFPLYFMVKKETI